jgi:DNA-binding MarR family transcriptional regulator
MNEKKLLHNEWKLGQLLAHLGRLHSKRLDGVMERIGLYRGQAILLITLSKKDGLTHSELAERLEISPAAATKVIKRMEELRYVQRMPDPTDERISRVFLQPEGWVLIQKIKNVFNQIDEILVSELSPEEQNTLIKLLTRVHASLLKENLDLTPPQE